MGGGRAKSLFIPKNKDEIEEPDSSQEEEKIPYSNNLILESNDLNLEMLQLKKIKSANNMNKSKRKFRKGASCTKLKKKKQSQSPALKAQKLSKKLNFKSALNLNIIPLPHATSQELLEEEGELTKQIKQRRTSKQKDKIQPSQGKKGSQKKHQENNNQLEISQNRSPSPKPIVKPVEIPYNKLLLKDQNFKDFYAKNICKAIFTFPKFTRNYSKNYKAV